MNEEQYWLVILKRAELFSDQLEYKEIAKVIALTPTAKQPEFNILMNGMLDGLKIERVRSGDFTYEIGYLCPSKTLLDKMISLPKWDGTDLKLWLAASFKDA